MVAVAGFAVWHAGGAVYTGRLPAFGGWWGESAPRFTESYFLYCRPHQFDSVLGRAQASLHPKTQAYYNRMFALVDEEKAKRYGTIRMALRRGAYVIVTIPHPRARRAGYLEITSVERPEDQKCPDWRVAGETTPIKVPVRIAE